jgi:crossover junction endodeoxyribonuclease RuvC
MLVLVLGIDPGVAMTGWGMVRAEGGRLQAVDFGSIRTEAHLPAHQRLFYVFQAVDRLVDEHRPEFLAVEQVFFNKNARSALAVGQARGVVMLAAAQKGVDVREYTPLQVKMAVVGHGAATKGQVQAMVKAILALREAPRPADVADALAVAVCCLHTCATERRLGLG